MFEPRGHDIMSGAIIYPAYREDCDFAVIFIEVSGCLPMCGAGTIGLATAAIEEGLVTPRTAGRLSIETPAGRVDIEYEKPGEFVESVRMFNVPSYLHAADVAVDVPGFGRLVVDIAYGGNYYAVVEPQESWAGLDGMSADQIVDISRKLREALADICDPQHPDNNRICGVHHAIWCDKPVGNNADGRGAVFYGDKAIDRSPGGTGTSARLAQLHGKGRLKVGEIFRQESLIGTVFEGRIEGEVDIGQFRGIKPSVGGWARIIGHNTIFVDDRDPLAYGFQIK
jgi:proline racemase